MLLRGHHDHRHPLGLHSLLVTVTGRELAQGYLDSRLQRRSRRCRPEAASVARIRLRHFQRPLCRRCGRLRTFRCRRKQLTLDLGVFLPQLIAAELFVPSILQAAWALKRRWRGLQTTVEELRVLFVAARERQERILHHKLSGRGISNGILQSCVKRDWPAPRTWRHRRKSSKNTKLKPINVSPEPRA